MLRHYQMGAADLAIANNAPITVTQAHAGKAELAKMRRSLVAWLKYRSINDTVASGNAGTIKSPVLKTPGAKAPPAAVMALRLRRERYQYEGELATQLYQLLSEVFDSQQLPEPNIDKNPKAAVQLAQIAVSGKLPGETTSPGAQGLVWMWPLVIIVGALAFVIMTAIKSSADLAAERERLECIKAGKCTDYGFWMKVGALAFVGWIVWDKFGVGQKLTSKKKGS